MALQRRRSHLDFVFFLAIRWPEHLPGRALTLLYVTLSLWTTYLIYFWISILALCVAPFLFDPHQLSFSDFTRESPSSNYRYAYS